MRFGDVIAFEYFVHVEPSVVNDGRVLDVARGPRFEFAIVIQGFVDVDDAACCQHRFHEPRVVRPTSARDLFHFDIVVSQPFALVDGCPNAWVVIQKRSILVNGEARVHAFNLALVIARFNALSRSSRVANAPVGAFHYVGEFELPSGVEQLFEHTGVDVVVGLDDADVLPSRD